jgi:hypothetical protein
VVDVSGANEYSVKPLALVSTVAPPIFAVFSAELDEVVPAEDEEPAPGELDGAELPHAAAIRARLARPAGTHHRLRMTTPAAMRDHVPTLST